MNFMERMDPDLAAGFQGFPDEGVLNFEDIEATRRMADEMMVGMTGELPPIEDVTADDQSVPVEEGVPHVPVRVYRPADRSGRLPALLWFHGGGYVFGSIDFDDRMSRQIVKAVGCMVVSVDYRLAPENPFPAPIEDCYSALKWMTEHADELGVEKTRIAVGGASAGGGLAAGLALLARDRAEVNITFQLLIYPMIDDRNNTPSSHAVTDPRLWSRDKNIFCWQAYLGQSGKGNNVSPYGAASRAVELAGLPPAYIAVGELDLFLDENIEYAQRLMQAGVSTELHVYPGAFHGFDGFVPDAGISKRFTAERDQALKYALRR